MEVAPGVHRIETDVGGRVACVILVQGQEGALLVDTGMSYAPADSILPYFDAVGLDRSKLRRIVITHSDFDHMGGGAELRLAFPAAQFSCHIAERAEAQDLEVLLAYRLGEFGRDHAMPDSAETLAWLRSNVCATLMDSVLFGGETIRLGGATVDIRLMAGHSAGHIGLLHRESGVAIIADAVLGSGLLFRDGRPAFPPTYRYVAPYLQTIAALRQLRPDILLTSHFPAMEGAAISAFLDQSESFVQALDMAVCGALRKRGEVTLRELSVELAPKFGDWEAEAGLLICWPILGHLERLVWSGAASCAVGPVPRRYRWIARH